MAKSTPKPSLLSPRFHEAPEEPIERSGSVDLPSVGEEGREYSALMGEAQNDTTNTAARSQTSSPEQTRTVAQDLQLHAPKPSLPANSAKQRVQAVTRTDSDKAAAFGIGHPSNGEDRPISRERGVSRGESRDRISKRPSTSMSGNSDQTEDEHGIPEIGQRVPMNRHLGDVQAPSPGPSEGSGRHHSRKHSARSLPPGSYGLHGHGLTPQDKLEKAYYQKHPEALEREENTPIHDRQNDFAMSSTDLNKLVRDTANRGGAGKFQKAVWLIASDTNSVLGTPEARGVPTDEVAFQASEEYARMSSPRPASAASKGGHRRSSSLAKVVSHTSNPSINEPEEGTIHVDDPRHPEYRSYGDQDDAVDEEEYQAPILASDEVQKDPNRYLQRPAVHPPAERRFSSNDGDSSPGFPPGRPLSLHKGDSQPEIRYTPLEDVEEYEPLFTEETKKEQPLAEEADENKHHNHFPSKDIWEDAPSSVHYTATVSTPDLPESEHHRSRSSGQQGQRPMTPAEAFAAHQEALAEKEARRRSGGQPLGPLPKGQFLPLSEQKPNWAAHQAHLKVERPASGPRFPSRDVWEDVPESQLQQATVSSPEEERKQPELPARPVKKLSGSSDKPAIPTRPKPRQGSGDEPKAKPPISDKPKPQIPARPAKSSSGDSQKEKPPVPARPVGGKIAALQAGFMSDLNKRLQLGPQAQKKEDPENEAEQEQEKEKAPLSDARKGRARGPQRRAPAKSPAPATAPPATSVPALSFSLPQVSWSIHPDEGKVSTIDVEEEEKAEAAVTEGSFVADPAPLTGIEDKPTQTATQAKQEEQKEEQNEPEAYQTERPQEDAEPQIEEVRADPSNQVAENTDDDRVEKTLVANTAGESILETHVEKKDDGDTVEPLEVEDTPKP